MSNLLATPESRAPVSRERLRGITRRLLATACALASSFSQLPAAAAAPATCEAEMAKASGLYAVPIEILYSVGLTETGGSGKLDPYAMDIDGRAVHSGSLQEALARFDFAVAHGAKLIDIGCMQINQYWHARDFASVGEMFDVARNVDYSARFLRSLRASEGSWTSAVARYNAGPNNQTAQRNYVCAVIGNMVHSGVGAWTPRARAFCE